jgi:hypothetical protein
MAASGIAGSAGEVVCCATSSRGTRWPPVSWGNGGYGYHPGGRGLLGRAAPPRRFAVLRAGVVVFPPVGDDKPHEPHGHPLDSRDSWDSGKVGDVGEFPKSHKTTGNLRELC